MPISLRRGLVGLAVAVLGLALALVAGGRRPWAPERTETYEQQIEQAREALDRWAQAVATVGGDQSFIWPAGGGPAEEKLAGGYLTDVVGGQLEEPMRMALEAGAIVASPEVLAMDGFEGVLELADGRSVPVAADTPANLIDLMVLEGQYYGSGLCPDCAPLTIVGATPTTTTNVPNLRATVSAPAWRFDIEGTSVQLIRHAVPWSFGVHAIPTEAVGRVGIGIAWAEGSDHRLEVGFIGAPSTADEELCGADYHLETYESDLAVVAIVLPSRHVAPLPRGFICTNGESPRTVTAQLAAPLGERAVLEVVLGMPVPLHNIWAAGNGHMNGT